MHEENFLDALEADLELLEDDSSDEIDLDWNQSPRQYSVLEKGNEEDCEWKALLESSVRLENSLSNVTHQVMEEMNLPIVFDSSLLACVTGDVESHEPGVGNREWNQRVETEILELMCEMLQAVERIAVLVAIPPRVLATPASLNLGNNEITEIDHESIIAPPLLQCDVGLVQSTTEQFFENDEIHQQIAARESAVAKEKQMLEEQQYLLALEADRLERLERKRKREAEFKRAKQLSCIARFQAHTRGMVARAAYRRVQASIAARKAAAAAAAEEEARQRELEERRRELERQRLEAEEQRQIAERRMQQQQQEEENARRVEEQNKEAARLKCLVCIQSLVRGVLARSAFVRLKRIHEEQKRMIEDAEAAAREARAKEQREQPRSIETDREVSAARSHQSSSKRNELGAPHKPQWGGTITSVPKPQFALSTDTATEDVQSAAGCTQISSPSSENLEEKDEESAGKEDVIEFPLCEVWDYDELRGMESPEFTQPLGRLYYHEAPNCNQGNRPIRELYPTSAVCTTICSNRSARIRHCVQERQRGNPETNQTPDLSHQNRGKESERISRNTRSPIITALVTWTQFTATLAKLLDDTSVTSKRRAEKEQLRALIEKQSEIPSRRASLEVATNILDDKILSHLGIRNTSDCLAIPTLELSVEGLTQSTFLRHFKSLRKLDLNVNKLTELNGLRGLSTLEELSVKDNSLGSVVELARCSSLKSIHLDTNKLTDLDALGLLPALTYLSASTNRLTTFPLLFTKSLQRLELYHNQIDNVPSGRFDQLLMLTHLDLGRNRLTFLSGTDLSRCQLLQTLVLSQNLLESPPSPLYLPHLKVLWLSGNRLTSLDNWRPISLQHGRSNGDELNCPLFLPLLERLLLQDNGITDLSEGVLSLMSSLTELDVSFNQLKDLDSLVGLSTGCPPTLRSLQLQDNPITKGLDRPLGRNRSHPSDVTKVRLVRWLQSACPSLLMLSNEPLVEEQCLTMQAIVESTLNCEENQEFRRVKRSLCRASRLLSYISNGSFIQRVPLFQSTPSVSMISRQLVCSIVAKEVGQFSRSLAATQNRDSSEIEAQQERPQQQQQQQQQEQQQQQQQQQQRLQQQEEDEIHSIDPRSLLSLALAEFSSQPGNIHTSYTVNKMQGLEEWTRYSKYFSLDELSRRFAALVELFPKAQVEMRKKERQRINAAQLSTPLADDDDAETDSMEALLIKQLESLAKWASRFCGVDLPNMRGFFGLANSVKSKKDEISCEAATHVQRLFRGCRVRRLLRQALDSAKYHDEELEALFASEGLENFQDVLNASEEEEFSKEWLRSRSSKHQKSLPVVGIDAEPTEEETDEGELSLCSGIMVYGDHRRSRREKLRVTQEHAKSQEAWAASHHDNVQEATSVSGDPVLSDCKDARPDTSFSDLSDAHSVSHTPISRDFQNIQPNSIAANSREFGFAPSTHRSERSSSGGDSVGGGGGPGSAKKAALASEWGINDPKLLAALVKRNKRMKSFQEAKEAREKEMDPQFRYEKFVQTANKSGNSSRQASGSFGGKPKTMRMSNKSGKSALVPPAWMVGSDL